MREEDGNSVGELHRALRALSPLDDEMDEIRATIVRRDSIGGSLEPCEGGTDERVDEEAIALRIRRASVDLWAPKLGSEENRENVADFVRASVTDLLDEPGKKRAEECRAGTGRAERSDKYRNRLLQHCSVIGRRETAIVVLPFLFLHPGADGGESLFNVFAESQVIRKKLGDLVSGDGGSRAAASGRCEPANENLLLSGGVLRFRGQLGANEPADEVPDLGGCRGRIRRRRFIERDITPPLFDERHAFLDTWAAG
ncbi:MAG: hypothetical protein IPN03_18520 [Holophagales bacterium]|nr:hypothetical protein [Holophagales bacterium]